MRSINSETWTHADGKWLRLHSHTSQFAAEQVDIWTLAEIIGTNAILALEFDDVEMAKEVLATLKANTNIMAAALYAAAENGILFQNMLARLL